jgi:transposase
VKTGEELVSDKGYHSKQTVLDVQSLGLRTYISEPDRGRQHWIDQHAERDAVYANRRRIRSKRGQQLMRRRGELLERPNAHLYETGGMRRTHLRGHGNILKRLLVHMAAANLGLWMRTLTGIGTPRGLQGRWAAVIAFFFTLWIVLCDRATAYRRRELDLTLFAIPNHRFAAIPCVL